MMGAIDIDTPADAQRDITDCRSCKYLKKRMGACSDLVLCAVKKRILLSFPFNCGTTHIPAILKRCRHYRPSGLDLMDDLRRRR